MIAVSLAAVLTRLQFVVVPLIYLIAAPLAGRLCGETLRFAVRRHALVARRARCARGRSAVESRCGLRHLRRRHGARLRPAHRAELDAGSPLRCCRSRPAGSSCPVPCSGWPCVAARPRGRAEAGFATLALSSVVLVLLEAGMIAAGEAGRAIERYEIYLIPLAAIAFFAYVERGAPWLRALRRPRAGRIRHGLADALPRDGPGRPSPSTAHVLHVCAARHLVRECERRNPLRRDPVPRRDRTCAASSSPPVRRRSRSAEQRSPSSC